MLKKAFQTAGILPLSMAAINGVIAQILSGWNSFSRISRCACELGVGSLLVESPWSRVDRLFKNKDRFG